MLVREWVGAEADALCVQALLDQEPLETQAMQAQTAAPLDRAAAARAAVALHLLAPAAADLDPAVQEHLLQEALALAAAALDQVTPLCLLHPLYA